MKNTLLSFLLCFTFLNVHAQLDYTLTHSNSTYSELSGATDVSAVAWNDLYKFKLPFQFKFFNKPADSMYITFDGVFFSDTGDDYIFYGTDNFMPQNAVPTMSPISYIISGNSPDRIVKVQYKNVRESSVDTNSWDYTINCQIWLYENGNKIEYRFGNSSITDPAFDAFYIGLIDFDNSPYLAIDSNATNPVLVRVTSSLIFNGIPAYPGSGKVITLTPKPGSGIAERSALPYRWFMSDNTLSILCKGEFTATVCDINGRNVQSAQSLAAESIRMDLNSLSPGVYLLNIRQGSNVYTEKIIVR